jgi:hypothetical protein
MVEEVQLRFCPVRYLAVRVWVGAAHSLAFVFKDLNDRVGLVRADK